VEVTGGAKCGRSANQPGKQAQERKQSLSSDDPCTA
jgi:hypothetical protein